MRSCLWSLLLVCLVLLVAPWQNAAAAAVVHCHEQTGMAANVEPATHATQVTHAQHGVGAIDKCSSCSPCCAGALVNTVQVLSLAAASGAAAFPDPSSPNPAPTLAGLDRPPRPLAL